MDNLKPCPFCGGRPNYRHEDDWKTVHDEGGAIIDVEVSTPTWFLVECSCGCQFITETSEKETIAAWNRRV